MTDPHTLMAILSTIITVLALFTVPIAVSYIRSGIDARWWLMVAMFVVLILVVVGVTALSWYAVAVT